MLRGLTVAALMLSVGGCASSEIDYQPPAADGDVQTERVLYQPFDQAWDHYVAELSRSFFVINNISRESRIINVSFSAKPPSDLIDCGRTTRIAKAPAIGEEKWEYATADDAPFRFGIPGTNLVGSGNQSTSLEGRANIFMAPQEENTLLRVNARYALEATTTIHDPRSAVPHSWNWSGSFSSGGQGDMGDGVYCVSNGALERQLLDLI